ncbi:hypothetical protein Tco_0485973, partial [Tanacetum coccineum]
DVKENDTLPIQGIPIGGDTWKASNDPNALIKRMDEDMRPRSFITRL